MKIHNDSEKNLRFCSDLAKQRKANTKQSFANYYIFFSKLSTKLRVDIISSLNSKEKSVSDLVKELKMEQSKLSHALKELRDCNIVYFEPRGKERVYFLNKTIKPILKLIDLHSSKCCNCNECNKCSQGMEK